MLALLAAVTATALIVGVSAAGAAKGGNSENAKLCQKGGWQDLVGSQGQSFASEEECVSYAAQGGTPLTTYQYLQSRYQAICEEGDGFFFLNGEAGWGCRDSMGALSQGTYDDLAAVCTEAGGTPHGSASHGTYFIIYCDIV